MNEAYSQLWAEGVSLVALLSHIVHGGYEFEISIGQEISHGCWAVQVTSWPVHSHSRTCTGID